MTGCNAIIAEVLLMFLIVGDFLGVCDLTHLFQRTNVNGDQTSNKPFRIVSYFSKSISKKVQMNLHRRPLLNNLNETRLLDGEATIQQNHTKLNMSNHKRYAFFLHPFFAKKAFISFSQNCSI